MPITSISVARKNFRQINKEQQHDPKTRRNFAPPEYQKVAHDMAVQMGLMPDKPDGYSTEGEPLYDLAEQYACAREAMIDKLADEVLDIADAYTGNVHRVN